MVATRVQHLGGTHQGLCFEFDPRCIGQKEETGCENGDTCIHFKHTRASHAPFNTNSNFLKLTLFCFLVFSSSDHGNVCVAIVAQEPRSNGEKGH